MASQVEHNDEKVSIMIKCVKFLRKMMDSIVYLDNVLLQWFKEQFVGVSLHISLVNEIEIIYVSDYLRYLGFLLFFQYSC